MAGRAHKWNFISALLPARLDSSNTWSRSSSALPRRFPHPTTPGYKGSSCSPGHANHFIAFICVHFAIVRQRALPAAKDSPPSPSPSNPIRPPARIKRNENCRALRRVKSNQPTCQIPLYYKNRSGGSGKAIEALTALTATPFPISIWFYSI